MTLRLGRPSTERALARVRDSHPELTESVLLAPSPGLSSFTRVARLPDSCSISDAGAVLASWNLHRRSGLDVAVDGPARVGTTVVLGQAFGPVSVLAPCRVVATVTQPNRIGFTYATLPGHPETGVEQFLFVRTADGLRFEVRAVSRANAWYSRMLPALTARIQAEQTQRYLDAAAALLSGA